MTMYVRFVQCSDFGMYSMPGARTVEGKRYRAVGQHGEIAAEQRKCGAFFDPSRQDTNALQTVFRGQTDIVGARVARSDAQTRAASYPAVVSSTPSNSSIRSFVVEELGPPAALGTAEPAGNCLDNPLASHRRRTEAAIEKHDIGSNQPRTCRRTIHGDSRLRQKCSKVLCDGGITGVGQAEFAQSCRPPKRRHVVRRGDWQEPGRQNLQDFLARQVSAERLSDDCTAATQDRDQHALQG